jgi:hypothetical protein
VRKTGRNARQFEQNIRIQESLARESSSKLKIQEVLLADNQENI